MQERHPAEWAWFVTGSLLVIAGGTLASVKAFSGDILVTGAGLLSVTAGYKMCQHGLYGDSIRSVLRTTAAETAAVGRAIGGTVFVAFMGISVVIGANGAAVGSPLLLGLSISVFLASYTTAHLLLNRTVV